MAYEILFHPLAAEEFNEAYQWYEERLPGLGDRFANAVDACLSRISNTPLLYSKKEADIGKAGRRTFLT